MLLLLMAEDSETLRPNTVDYVSSYTPLVSRLYLKLFHLIINYTFCYIGINKYVFKLTPECV